MFLIKESGEANRTVTWIGRIVLGGALIFCLVIVIVMFNRHWSAMRDARRTADIQAIRNALEIYSAQLGQYPDTQVDKSGWDTTLDVATTGFLSELKQKGFLKNSPFDPINDQDYYYRYQFFPANSFGCTKPFYIFQVMKFETEGVPGVGSCPKKDFTQQAPLGFTLKIDS